MSSCWAPWTDRPEKCCCQGWKIAGKSDNNGKSRLGSTSTNGAELRHDFVEATRLPVPSEGRAALLELFAEELLCLLQLAHKPQQAGQVVHAAHRLRVRVAKLRPASAPAVRGIERGMCVLPSYGSPRSPGLMLQYINHFPSCIWRQNRYSLAGRAGQSNHRVRPHSCRN